MKVQKMIVLDANLCLEVKSRGLNLSGLVNDFLKQYLGIKDDTSGKKLSQLKDELMKEQVSLAKKQETIKKLEEKKASSMLRPGESFVRH